VSLEKPAKVTASEPSKPNVTRSTRKTTGQKQKRQDPEEPTPQEQTQQDSQPLAKRTHRDTPNLTQDKKAGAGRKVSDWQQTPGPSHPNHQPELQHSTWPDCIVILAWHECRSARLTSPIVVVLCRRV